MTTGLWQPVASRFDITVRSEDSSPGRVEMHAVDRGSWRSPARLRAATVVVFVALIGAAACSGDHSKNESAEPAASTTTTTPRPAGPTADLSTEITDGQGAFIGSAYPTNLGRDGYVEHEYVAAG